MTKILQHITQDGWTLTNDQGEPIHVGQKVKDFRGDSVEISGGTTPHRPGTSGYVTTAEGAEFYPSVFNLRWVSPEGRYFGDGQGIL